MQLQSHNKDEASEALDVCIQNRGVQKQYL
jgi:hypothetical protein